jgi:hypothetical protein
MVSAKGLLRMRSAPSVWCRVGQRVVHSLRRPTAHAGKKVAVGVQRYGNSSVAQQLLDKLGVNTL